MIQEAVQNDIVRHVDWMLTNDGDLGDFPEEVKAEIRENLITKGQGM
jgi:hypothetical protein